MVDADFGRHITVDLLGFFDGFTSCPLHILAVLRPNRPVFRFVSARTLSIKRHPRIASIEYLCKGVGAALTLRATRRRIGRILCFGRVDLLGLTVAALPPGTMRRIERAKRSWWARSIPVISDTE